MFDFTSGGNAGFSSIQMMGIINALKTGDPTLDTVLAMVLPLIISKLFSTILNPEFIKRLFRKPGVVRQKVTQSIKFSVGGSNNNNLNRLGQPSTESYNCHLAKAIELYLHHFQILKIRNADIELSESTSMAISEDGATKDQIMKRLGLMPRAQNSNSNSVASTAKILAGCELIKKPVKGIWHNVGMYEGDLVSIQYKDSGGEKKKENNDNGNQGFGSQSSSNSSGQTFEILLESYSTQAIDSFIKVAYDWYMEQLKSIENNNRYYYDLVGFEGRGNNETPIFKKYLLSEEKTFDCIFSRTAKSVLSSVDQFLAKKGKYAIRGYPHKKGILLHGPPGSGKTSFIKALAQYTGRQIVNVPLSRITKNQELCSVFFNENYKVVGNMTNIPLSAKQVIFVLEDVDATSKVVRDRNLKDPEPEVVVAAPAPASDTQSNANTSNRRMLRPTSFKPVDELDLSGILNALDGIVESPGRMIVMTTNHPEMLDPALLRPGRIDHSLLLGHMEAEDMIDMFSHYYGSDAVTEAHMAAIRSLVNEKGLNLTPALVEQKTMEMESVESMIEWLTKRSKKINFESHSPSSSSHDPRSVKLKELLKLKENNASSTSLAETESDSSSEIDLVNLFRESLQ